MTLLISISNIQITNFYISVFSQKYGNNCDNITLKLELYRT